MDCSSANVELNTPTPGQAIKFILGQLGRFERAASSWRERTELTQIPIITGVFGVDERQQPLAANIDINPVSKSEVAIAIRD
jgi:hypothetical protein